MRPVSTSPLPSVGGRRAGWHGVRDGNPVRRLVQRAHEVNRNPTLVALARRGRERAFGADHRREGFVTDRGRAAELAARQLVTLRGDEPGLLGELGLTALQGWQRLAESQDRGHGKVDVAILFTDLVGFSSWALEAGDEDALRLLRKVSSTIEPTITKRRGEVVKRLGDGVMAVFWDAPSAVETAIRINESIGAIEVEGYRPQLRTGIHLGRPRKLRGDYFGVDVNIAARLTEAARPGEILISNRTLEMLPPDLANARHHRFNAKGVPADISAFSLIRPETGPLAALDR